MAKKDLATKGEGFVATLRGKTLTIEVDVGRKGKESASGKSVVVASTRVIGGVSVDGKTAKGLYMALNVFRKRK